MRLTCPRDIPTKIGVNTTVIRHLISGRLSIKCDFIPFNFSNERHIVNNVKKGQYMRAPCVYLLSEVITWNYFLMKYAVVRMT